MAADPVYRTHSDIDTAGARVTAGFCRVRGDHSDVSGVCSIVYGAKCTGRASGLIWYGDDGVVESNSARIIGARCKLSGNNVVISGDDCDWTGDGARISGKRCTVRGRNYKFDNKDAEQTAVIIAPQKARISVPSVPLS